MRDTDERTYTVGQQGAKRGINHNKSGSIFTHTGDHDGGGASNAVGREGRFYLAGPPTRPPNPPTKGGL